MENPDLKPKKSLLEVRKEKIEQIKNNLRYYIHLLEYIRLFNKKDELKVNEKDLLKLSQLEFHLLTNYVRFDEDADSDQKQNFDLFTEELDKNKTLVSELLKLNNLEHLLDKKSHRVLLKTEVEEFTSDIRNYYNFPE